MPYRFFDHLLPQSDLALKMAVAIHQTEGMEGWIHIYLPADKHKPCEVMTSTNGWQLSMEPTSFNPRKGRRSGV